MLRVHTLSVLFSLKEALAQSRQAPMNYVKRVLQYESTRISQEGFW